jgi:hypothetical protein
MEDENLDEVVDLMEVPPPPKPWGWMITMIVWGIGFVLYWIGLWGAAVTLYIVPTAGYIGIMTFCISSGIWVFYIFNMMMNKMTLIVSLVGMTVILLLHIISSIAYYFVAYTVMYYYAVIPLQANIIVAFILIVLIASSIRRLVRFTGEIETVDKIKNKFLLYSFTMFFIVTGILLEGFGNILRFDAIPESWNVLGSIVGSLFIFFGLGLSFNSLMSIHTDDRRYIKYLKIESLSFVFTILLEILMIVFVTIAHIIYNRMMTLLTIAWAIHYLPFNIVFTLLFGVVTIYVGIMTWITMKTSGTGVEEPQDEQFETLQEQNE